MNFRKWLSIFSVGAAATVITQAQAPAVDQAFYDWLLMTIAAWVGYSVTQAIIRKIHKGGSSHAKSRQTPGRFREGKVAMPKAHRIEINNIFYDYTSGAMWTSIRTAEWQWGEVPAYLRVEELIQTPISMLNAEIRSAVERMIRQKTAEQRRKAEAQAKAKR